MLETDSCCSWRAGPPGGACLEVQGPTPRQALSIAPYLVIELVVCTPLKHSGEQRELVKAVLLAVKPVQRASVHHAWVRRRPPRGCSTLQGERGSPNLRPKMVLSQSVGVSLSIIALCALVGAGVAVGSGERERVGLQAGGRAVGTGPREPPTLLAWGPADDCCRGSWLQVWA